MGDLREEIDKWCQRNNFKEVRNENRISKHERGSRDVKRTSGDGQQVLRAEETDLLPNRVQKAI